MISTNRLTLRRWRPEDLDTCAAMCADPKVMKYFPSTLNRSETEAMIQLIEERIDRNGFSFWAAELKATRELIGFVGLNIPGYPLPFAPCVEIGWRLAHAHWGQGYAQEGARACLKYGFETVGIKEVVSFTAVENLRSRRVMEQIGMTYDSSGDFDHPKVKEGHPLRRHVLYRIKREMKV